MIFLRGSSVLFDIMKNSLSKFVASAVNKLSFSEICYQQYIYNKYLILLLHVLIIKWLFSEISALMKNVGENRKTYTLRSWPSWSQLVLRTWVPCLLNLISAPFCRKLWNRCEPGYDIFYTILLIYIHKCIYYWYFCKNIEKTLLKHFWVQ